MEQQLPITIVAQDGKEMVYIPAGEFLKGEEKKSVYVEAFYIDKYPVTNAEYKKFVDATGYPPPLHWQRGKIPEGKENHPVVQVNWDDAATYAKWAGKRLPTEDEWEKAARGTDGRIYPWGNEWDKPRANTCETRILDTTPVGQFSPQGDSPYGVADMAGNVWEWTAGTGGRVLQPMRGGSWDTTHDAARCFSRLPYTPRRRNDYIGFRCAISANEVSAFSSGSKPSSSEASCSR